jgi:hypothetical protein
VKTLSFLFCCLALRFARPRGLSGGSFGEPLSLICLPYRGLMCTNSIPLRLLRLPLSRLYRMLNLSQQPTSPRHVKLLRSC